MEQQKEATKSSAISPAQQIQLMNLPKLYANSFGIGTSLSDLFITLMVNGQPSHQLFLSLPAAKTLAQGLQKAIEEYEELTKTKVPDMLEINKK